MVSWDSVIWMLYLAEEKSQNKIVLYKVSKVVLGAIFKLYYNPKIVGKEKIPKDGSIIADVMHRFYLFWLNVYICCSQ